MKTLMNAPEDPLRFLRRLAAVVPVLLLAASCASAPARPDPAPPAAAQAEPREKLRIQEFYLSPGDEIKVSVYKHDELSRTIKIPPDGRFFYPLVGEVDTTGMSLRQLRDHLTKGISTGREPLLMPGDEIRVSVFRHRDLDRTIVIPADGKVMFPYCSQVHLGGKTPKQASEVIAAGLSGQFVDPQVMVDITRGISVDIVSDPQVSLEVTGFGGQKFYVLGEVVRPGVFRIDGGTTLVEALSLAGGATLDGKQQTVLVMRNGGQAKPQLLVFNMESFYKSGDPEQNPVLRRGDLVYVPRTFISDVDRFFTHLTRIVAPLVAIETGIRLGQEIGEGAPEGGDVSISVQLP